MWMSSTLIFSLCWMFALSRFCFSLDSFESFWLQFFLTSWQKSYLCRVFTINLLLWWSSHENRDIRSRFTYHNIHLLKFINNFMPVFNFQLYRVSKHNLCCFRLFVKLFLLYLWVSSECFFTVSLGSLHPLFQIFRFFSASHANEEFIKVVSKAESIARVGFLANINSNGETWVTCVLISYMPRLKMGHITSFLSSYSNIGPWSQCNLVGMP